jgi:hypothetical protein
VDDAVRRRKARHGSCEPRKSRDRGVSLIKARTGTSMGEVPVLGPFAKLADFLVNHQSTRLVFVVGLALLPLALVALVREKPWLFLAVTALSAVTDGNLRLAPLGQGRLLRVIRDRATQTSTLRIGLIAAAFVTMTDELVAAVIIGAGLVLSVLCRVVAGWLQEGVVRAGRTAVGAPVELGMNRWLTRGSVAVRYIRGLAFSELVMLVALTVA